MTPTQLAAKLAIQAKDICNTIVKEPIQPHTTSKNISDYADEYAQTVTYGLLAAKLMAENTNSPFTRSNIPNLLPIQIKQTFLEMLNPSHDKTNQCVTQLISFLNQTNIKTVFSNLPVKNQDPIIHFYELFLAKYKHDTRKAKGVYYTPQQVVDFIVLSIHTTLQNTFGLPLGLASTQTWEEVSTHKDIPIPKGHKKKPFVCILDPSTGTGTFLKKTIQVIRQTMKQHWKHLPLKTKQKNWNEYVRGIGKYKGKGLLNRLYGFEVMFAPHIIAHLRLGKLLEQDKTLPFSLSTEDTLHILLTNALENKPSLQDICFTIVVGNPPYLGASKNKSTWIMDLLQEYKIEPSGENHQNNKLQERNSKWLNDDYVKFFRMGQYHIEKSGVGILGYITPHGFLDNPTFRGMRWYLWTGFNDLYIINLHGNKRKNEISPDGSMDENIFYIMQGISINLLIKTSSSPTIRPQRQYGNVHYLNKYGTQNTKYQWLTKISKTPLHTLPFQNIPTLNKHFPFHFMVPKNEKRIAVYMKGFPINKAFIKHSVGIVTARDKLVIDIDKQTLHKRIHDFYILPTNTYQQKYNVQEKDNWKIDVIRQKSGCFSTGFIQPISYRPFDKRYIYYNEHFIERSRKEVITHLLPPQNIGLLFRRQQPTNKDLYVFVSKNMIADGYIRSDNKGSESIAPLFLISKDKNNFKNNFTNNINQQILLKTEQIVKTTITPHQFFDYIYGVLHSRHYRNQYHDLLCIDFPRIPYPKSPTTFWSLCELGHELRMIHLFEHKMFNNITPTLTNNDSCSKQPLIDRYKWKNNQIWINKTQYFPDISEHIWNFHIGGYKPAQKWLKDRKGKILHKREILHYTKIIVALKQTNTIMIKIEKIDF